MNHPRLSVLFIEDERETANPFSRQRITYACTAEEINRESPIFADIMNRIQDRHGQLMALLRSLLDFHLFRLTPEHAICVRGFAQAFSLTGEDLGGIQPVRAIAHRPDESATVP